MLWNPLERGNTVKPLEIVQILFENLVRKSHGKSILRCAFTIHMPVSARQHYVLYFLCVCVEMLFCRMIQ